MQRRTQSCVATKLSTIGRILVSSDPYAWLRPIFRRLTADRKFALLAPETQYDRLATAAAAISAQAASGLRGVSSAARIGLLRHLASLESLGTGPARRELWRADKGGRHLVCHAVYLPHGIDLRLLEDGDIRRTVLLRDGPSAEARARACRCERVGVVTNRESSPSRAVV